MRRGKSILRTATAVVIGAVASVFTCTTNVAAQQTTVTTPFQQNGSSFYEGIGTQWGASGPGWFFQFGGPPVRPPFAAGDPNGGAAFGGGFRNGNTSGYFRLFADQGSSTTSGGSSPSVTIPNGGYGFLSDAVQRPFVFGVVPVVGDAESPLVERLSRLQQERAAGITSPKSQSVDEGDLVIGDASAERASGGTGGGMRGGPSTAERGDLSVAEIRERKRLEEFAQQKVLDDLVAKADQLVRDGKPGVARTYLKMAERKAFTDDQRLAIAKRLEMLK